MIIILSVVESIQWKRRWRNQGRGSYFNEEFAFIALGFLTKKFLNPSGEKKPSSQVPKVPAEDYPVTYIVDTGEEHIIIDSCGVVTAVAPGTAVVTASITDGTNTFSIQVEVTVADTIT